MNTKINYTVNPTTNDPIWEINEMEFGEGENFIRDFLEKYKNPDYSLSIYDTESCFTVEVDCKYEEIEDIVYYFFNMEHAFPIKFIEINSNAKRYIVGMPFTKGRFECPGYYKSEDGKIVKAE